MIIRKAEGTDSRDLVIWHTAQKLYWGYYKEFLDNCREDLTITEEYIAANQVYVLEKENKIVAFYSFYLKQKKLESLFIDPDYIGKGLGKFLWSDLLREPRN